MGNVRGADILLHVNTGTPELPVWTAVAGQRNSEISLNSDTIETTSKDTIGGWKTYTAGMKEWSLSCESLLNFEDAGYQLLETAFLNNEALLVQLKTTDGNGFEGEAVITSFPISADYSDMAIISIEMSGSSDLRKITAV